MRIYIRSRTKLKKIENQHSASAKRRRRRHPVGTYLDGAQVLFYGILFFFGGTNRANFSNGIAWSLYSLSYLPFAIGYTFFLYRMVGLGARIIPLKGIGSNQHQQLRSFNQLGKILMTFQIFSLFGSTTVLIMFSPIYPEYETSFVVVGISFKIVFMLVNGLGIVNQVERCIRTINHVNSNVTKTLNIGNQDVVATAIRRMRYNELLVLSIAFPVAIVLILTGEFSP